MEKALWNGKIVYASDIEKKYELEKTVRKASGNCELCCPEPDCNEPVLKYCHGDKKHAYFAHRHNSNCDYAEYDKSNSSAIIVNAKKTLFRQLSNKNYDVECDVKVFEHHYAHIVILENGIKTAFELVTNRISVNRVDQLLCEYQKHGVNVVFVLVGEGITVVHEDKINFIKRFSLNEAKNNTLLIIEEGSKLHQYKLDTFKYTYLGNELWTHEKVYYESGNIEDLIFENGSISIEGFEERYSKWYDEKQKRYVNFLKPVKRETEVLKQPTIQEPIRITPVASKSKISKPTVETKQYDTSNPKDKKDLLFLLDINLPKKDIKIDLGIWHKTKMRKELEKICYEHNEISFRNLMMKIKYASSQEQIWFNELYEEFKLTRQDYCYILGLAVEKVYANT